MNTERSEPVSPVHPAIKLCWGSFLLSVGTVKLDPERVTFPLCACAKDMLIFAHCYLIPVTRKRILVLRLF